MAKLRQANKTGTSVVWEDPRSNGDIIYIYGDAHDLSTLSPIFGFSLVTRTDGFTISQIGNTATPNGDGGNASNNASGDSLTYNNAGVTYSSLALTKDSSFVRHTLNTGNHPSTNISFTFAASMNPSYPARAIKEVQEGERSAYIWTNHSGGTSDGDIVVWTNPTKDFYEERPSRIYGGFGTTNFFTNNSNFSTNYNEFPAWFFYYDSNQSSISGISENTMYRANYSEAGGVIRPVKIGTFPDFASITYAGSHESYYTYQFLGLSTGGAPLYFYTEITDDHGHKVVQHNMSDNTTTDVYTFTAAPAAAGTSIGGTRSTSAPSMGEQAKLASKLMDDPTSSGNKCWYVPYFDTAQNYHPFFFQWDLSNDTVVRNEDVSVVDSQDTAAPSSSHLSALPGNFGEYSRLSSIVYNEHFTTEGKTFLLLAVLHGAYRALDASQNRRTYITYEIDATDPKKLIEHSTLELNATPRNIVWLNDAKTLMGIFYETSFGIYNFTDATGWVESTVIAQQFWAVGRDRNDRIWGVAYSPSGHADVHLITPTLPVTIKIIPENDTYNYQGSTINTFFTLEAINAQGNRIETDVTLVIDGFTMTFDDDTKSKIVTTSTTAAVQVPIKIIDSGFSSIISSVTL